MSPKEALPKGLWFFYDVVEGEFRSPTIGLMIGSILFGIILSQTAYYYRTYPNDDRKIKILVAVLGVLELAHLVSLMQAAWIYFVYAKVKENFTVLFRAPTGFALAFLISVLITTLVQGFYAWRVWLISNQHYSRNYVVGVIVFLTLLQFVWGIVTVIPQFGPKSITGAHDKFRSASYSVQLASAMLCDLLISVALVWFLRRARSPFRSSRNVVDRLVIYSVNVGILTTVMAIATFAVYHTSPKGFQFVALIDTMSKVYVNSLLVTLNSRRGLRKAYNTRESQRFPLSDRLPTGVHIVKTVEATVTVN